MARIPTLVLDNDSYDGQLQRTLAASYVGMADLGESVAVARRVGKADPDRWYAEWFAQADRCRETAGSATTVPIRRGAYLRASEYYRQACFFIRHDPTATRLLDAYRRHVEMFEAAVPLLDAPVTPLRVPFEGHSLGGYLFAPDDSGRARPTIIAPCGYDSTAQEGYTGVPAALANGYNVVTFDGPGQGGALFLDRLYFRPDFAPVLTAVLDEVLARPEVDAEAVVLFGRSFAGYLSPQAAATEHRIAALVCDPAQPDMGLKLPTGLVGKVAGPVVELQTRLSGERAEFFGARMAAHGIDRVEAYLDELRRFTMTDVAAQITCPTLLVECEGDFVGGGGPILEKLMTAPTTLVDLTAAQGAGGHCAGLGQRVWEAVVFEWLDGVLRRGQDT